jgi:beta-xylosidase
VPPASGEYLIATETDDGVRLWIGGELVIDDWNGHFVTRNEATVTLDASLPVPIRLDYFEYDLDASVRLLWSSPTIPEEIIPETHLLTPGKAPEELDGPKPPFTNPVVPFDCPDPGVLAAPDADPPGYYALCTGGSFPIRFSKSLVFWQDTGASVLPEGKPPWAANGYRNWAPEIHRVGDHYVVYYTTVNGADVLSIGAAYSSDVLGPYKDTGGPLVEHPSGVIDPHFFRDDDGTAYLLYKIDGNAVGEPTPNIIRRLAPDGLSFGDGAAEVELLTNNPATWEGGVVEGAWMVKRDGFYYIFYSGNVYDYRYRTGVARSKDLFGPYEKHGAPILANNGRWVGPGHGSVVPVGPLDYFVYHAWTNNGAGTQDGALGRQILVDRIRWQDGWPSISDGTPSTTPQPWPGKEQ